MYRYSAGKGSRAGQLKSDLGKRQDNNNNLQCLLGRFVGGFKMHATMGALEVPGWLFASNNVIATKSVIASKVNNPVSAK